MAPDVLRGCLQAKIDTEFNWSLVDWGTITIVDDCCNSSLLRKLGNSLQVLHGIVPTVGRLEVIECSVWLRRILPVVDGGTIDVGGSNAEAGKDHIEHLLRPGVGSIDRNDVVARLHAGKYPCEDGGGTAVEHEAVFSTIE